MPSFNYDFHKYAMRHGSYEPAKRKKDGNVREFILEVLGGSMAHMKFRCPLLCVKNP